MKKLLLIAAIVMFAFACSKPNVPMELFSPDAFAFEVDNGYELNTSIRVKGFNKVDTAEVEEATVNYMLNIITADNDTIKNVYAGKVSGEGDDEEFMEMEIEVQVLLDASFESGKYTLEFLAQDNNSTEKDTSVIGFEL